MGGTIGVEDRPGGGSIFWFEMDLPTVVGRASDTPRLADRRVLVAHPLDVVRTAYRSIYESEGAVVDEVSDAASCLARVEAAASGAGAYDVVVVDHRMDATGGVDLCGKVRASPAGADLRIVLATPLDSGDQAADEPSPFDVRIFKPARRCALLDAAGARRDEAEPAADLSAPEPLGSSRSLGRVLLAEDNPVNTMLAVTVLEAMGCDVDCVTNGIDAVAAACAGDYALILMDVHMPEMDGLQATSLIRASGAACAEVPIIAMTADATAKDQDTCLSAGMNDFISKPINIDSFANVVTAWIEHGPAAGGNQDTSAVHAMAASR
jgi:CheY-like chemotaxis protein